MTFSPVDEILEVTLAKTAVGDLRNSGTSGHPEGKGQAGSLFACLLLGAQGDLAPTHAYAADQRLSSDNSALILAGCVARQ